jgi:hypothetical protein
VVADTPVGVKVCAALSWENANYLFAYAFTMTIFGYSAPKSDLEAVGQGAHVRLCFIL